jgi:hypothetical protein
MLANEPEALPAVTTPEVEPEMIETIRSTTISTRS